MLRKSTSEPRGFLNGNHHFDGLQGLNHQLDGLFSGSNLLIRGISHVSFSFPASLLQAPSARIFDTPRLSFQTTNNKRHPQTLRTIYRHPQTILSLVFFVLQEFSTSTDLFCSEFAPPPPPCFFFFPRIRRRSFGRPRARRAPCRPRWRPRRGEADRSGKVGA